MILALICTLRRRIAGTFRHVWGASRGRTVVQSSSTVKDSRKLVIAHDDREWKIRLCHVMLTQPLVWKQATLRFTATAGSITVWSTVIKNLNLFKELVVYYLWMGGARGVGGGREGGGRGVVGGPEGGEGGSFAGGTTFRKLVPCGWPLASF